MYQYRNSQSLTKALYRHGFVLFLLCTFFSWFFRRSWSSFFSFSSCSTCLAIMKSGSNSSRSYNQVKLSIQCKANIFCYKCGLFIYLSFSAVLPLTFKPICFRTLFSSLLGNLYFIFKKLAMEFWSWFLIKTVQVLQNWICGSTSYFRYCLSNKGGGEEETQTAVLNSSR